MAWFVARPNFRTSRQAKLCRNLGSREVNRVRHKTGSSHSRHRTDPAEVSDRISQCINSGSGFIRCGLQLIKRTRLTASRIHPAQPHRVRQQGHSNTEAVPHGSSGAPPGFTRHRRKLALRHSRLIRVARSNHLKARYRGSSMFFFV